MTTLNFRKIKTITYKPGKSKLINTIRAIKLSANESALGVSSKVKKILDGNNLNISKYQDGNKVNISKYPDGNSTQLREKISV